MAEILIVDDDVAILKFGEVLLGKFGYSVKTSDNVLDAIEKIKSNDFDLVLTDANMPRFTGFDLVRTLRSEDRFKDLPVAMLTGRKEKEDIKRAIALGIDDYIIKPIKPELFIQKVRSLLDRKGQAKKTKEESADVQLEATGFVRLEINLTGINDQGVEFVTPQFFDKGTSLSLGSILLSENGLQLPQLKVSQCTPIEKDEREHWLVKTVYCGATEDFKKKINDWIQSMNNQKMAS
jgi:two-component system chemotaxis response regulator CheY